ncbi:MAG: heme-dependent peroxidase, partial [Planctomycetales bacterium]|nr:heme-dependent peroxidase [Planctomycetales bacterium]
MSQPARPSDLPEPSTTPSNGWHCTHMYYRLNRSHWSQRTPGQRSQGREQLARILDPTSPDAPMRMQSFIVSGHKA